MLTTEYLLTLTTSQRDIEVVRERIKCATNYKYLIETYFSVDAGGIRKPFILFPHQKQALSSYLKYPNNITMKTRQMGFTTFTAAFIACRLINNSNYKTLIISKEMKSSKDFLKVIKDMLDNARKLTKYSNTDDSASWLIPEYKDGYNNKESFELENGSKVVAQGNTEDSGRGIPGLHLAVVDEVAFIDRKSPQRMHAIWAALGPALSTVKGSTIMISTPYGSSGWYYDTYTTAKASGFNIIDAHWTVHPLFNQGQYQWIIDKSLPDEGYVKFYNETWPDQLFDKDSGTYLKVDKDKYNFVKDGKIRSPWYDFESKKLGPRATACELDCGFAGTGGEVLSTDLLRDMKMYANTMEYGKITDQPGVMQDIKVFKPYEFGDNYVLTSDVATGDGSDFSTGVVLNMTKMEVALTFKIQVLPQELARVLFFIGYQYNKCPIVVENAGGGGTTLQELKVMHYPSIYYSTLNKKDESLGVKKKKLGLWVSEEVRMKGGDQLELFLTTGVLRIPCIDIVDELYTWIWDKDGRRRHAPGKHDDLIMALQHAVYYFYYIYKRNQRNRNNFDMMFNVQKNGIQYDNPNGVGMFVNEVHAFNPYKEKRNNGIDVIDNTQDFTKKNNDDKRQGMFMK